MGLAIDITVAHTIYGRILTMYHQILTIHNQILTMYGQISTHTDTHKTNPPAPLVPPGAEERLSDHLSTEFRDLQVLGTWYLG